MIEALSDVRLTVAPDPWPMDDDLRARVEAHWAAAVAANPRLWNGRVFGTIAPGRPGGIAIQDGILSGSVVEWDYAAFLAWRDWGFPEVGLRNLFGSALVTTADGALIYGVMGAHTANAGRIYPPGGSLEPRDLMPDGRVDVLRSIGVELQEETGLPVSEAESREILVAFDGPRVSIGLVLHFPLPVADLAERIRDALARQEERELEDVLIVRSVADLPDDRVPGYARQFAARLAV